MKKEEDNVFTYMTSCIEKKRKMGKDSTADLYRASSNWLKEFCQKDELAWEEITEELVDQFAEYLKTKRLMTNSRNSYLSNVRAMYNAAVDDRLVPLCTNPFSHLRLKREKTERRALPKDIIEQIVRLDVSGRPDLKQAVDFYIFSYLACGMPFVDMASLTHENIQGNKIIYNRVKTGMKVSIGITPGMRILMARYHRKGSLRLFPILPNREKVSHETYKGRLHQNNKCLKEVGVMLGLEIELTTYVARHSWASQAQEEDIPIAVISQNLGHGSEGTTRFYLAELSQDKLNKESWRVTKGVDNIVCGHV